MKALAVILQGQIRTFFTKDGCTEFLQVLNTSLRYYDKIYVSIIISGEYDRERIDWFKSELDRMNVTWNIIFFDTTETDRLTDIKLKNPNFIVLKDRYINTHTYAKNEISNVDAFTKNACYQFHQILIGINDILIFEKKTDIQFECIMKTRFDVKYHSDFFPNYPKDSSSFEEKLCFNEKIRFLIKNVYNIDTSSDDFIQQLKNKRIIYPECRVSQDFFSKSFGGTYLYNWHSLENIKNGDSNILYCLNDHVLFGNRDVFLKLSNLLDSYGTIECSININHYYAQEAQLLMFCIKNKINPLMYHDKEIHDIIR